MTWSFTSLSVGMFSTVHLPSSPTVASPILLPSLSFNSILAPGTPSPVTSVAPSFGFKIVGCADVSSAVFAAIVASSVAGFLSFSVCSAVTFSPSTSLSAGMSLTVQLPSLSTVALPISLPSLSFNTTVAPGTPVPDTLVSPAFGSVIVGFALVSSAFAATVASSLAGFFPGSVCSAVTFSPWTNLSAGILSTVHLPSLSTVALPISLPSLSFNTTVAPGTPVPDTLVSPAFGSVIVGFALSSCAFPTVASSVAGFLSFSVCSAVTFSPSTNLSFGILSTVHLPSLSTVALPISLPSLSFNTTVAPGTPVPDTLVSPAFGSVIVGFALSSCAASFQTAYTVFASVIFLNIPSSAAVAVFELAQPTNSFPSLVGFFTGGVTVLSSFVLTLFSVVPSSNCPPFASKVTNFSSDHTA
ncbi:Uncharacterised protein [Peptoniphilus gorbachii]|uniref:Uncharacterized protein n=1 Tax=Peptoniphilus gorbachii TaxID=411567 RepID=A0A6N3A1Y4_9FIRM